MTPRDMAGVATAPASGTARDPIGDDVGSSVVAGPGRTRDGAGVAESAVGATPLVTGTSSGVVVAATRGRPATSTAGSWAARGVTAPAPAPVSGSTLGIGPPLVGMLAGADGAEAATGARAPGS